ncbi:MAG: aminomethyl-transferring glycine dehydrogenase subunit GcvPA [Chloroflexota bacterium]
MSYLPHTEEERAEMLDTIGVDRLEDLFANVPAELRSGPLNLPPGMSEMEVRALLDSLAAENLNLQQHPGFLGAGAYHHFIPSAVGAITGRSEFSTSYTPYQAEVSQGTLQVIYEYQTLVAELTGMDVANASLYDAATAVVEAAKMAINETRRDTLVVAGGMHPEYRRVLQTYMRGEGFELREVAEDWVLSTDGLDTAVDEGVAGVIVQSPNFWGALEPMGALAHAAHRAGAQFIAVGNPLTLALLSPPGEYGADIACGCGQPFGIPLMYGGPYLGIIAARAGLARRLPGRISGATVDQQGRRGYVLTMQAREQHIRREKAASNICTNHQLMALAATVYLALMGKEGIRKVANLCVQKAHYAASRLAQIPGFSLAYGAPFFNEFTLSTPVSAAEVNRLLLDRGVVGGFDLAVVDAALDHHLLLSFTELNTRDQIDDLVANLTTLQPVGEPVASGVRGST